MTGLGLHRKKRLTTLPRCKLPLINMLYLRCAMNPSGKSMLPWPHGQQGSAICNCELKYEINTYGTPQPIQKCKWVNVGVVADSVDPFSIRCVENPREPGGRFDEQCSEHALRRTFDLTDSRLRFERNVPAGSDPVGWLTSYSFSFK